MEIDLVRAVGLRWHDSELLSVLFSYVKYYNADFTH